MDSLPYWLEALLPAPDARGKAPTDGSKTFYFAFPSAPLSDYGPLQSTGFLPFNASQQALVRKALAYVATLIDLRFVETANAEGANTLSFSNHVDATPGIGARGYFPGTSIISNDVQINLYGRGTVNLTATDPSFAAFTLIHEIGHALGLKHSFNEGEGAYLSAAEDSTLWTIMSYTYANSDYSLHFAPLDIAALQAIYGPSVLGASDSTIVLSATRTNLIWDGGGIDTIDGSAIEQAITLSLAPGQHSYIGSKSALITAPGQITINLGSVIENAIGGSGADSLTGSATANELTGGGGNDTIDGAAGSDIALYSANLAGYTLTKSGAGYTVKAKSGAEGSDRVLNVETLKFADMTVNLGIQAKAAAAPQADVQRLVELYVAFFNRVPEADGLSYWIDVMGGGTSLNTIAQSFYDVAIQYSSLSGYTASMSSADFLKIVYKNVLGRTGTTAPPDGDLAYWATRLADGRDTKASLINTLLTAAHNYKGDATWGWVADLLDNKVAVAKSFSIDWGLGYTSAETSIANGMAIASAVSPTDTGAALALIGISPADIELT